MLDDLKAHNIKTVLIHNCGKVASGTLWTTLKKSAPELDLHRVHYLSPKFVALNEEMRRSQGCPQSYRDDADKHLGRIDSLRALVRNCDPEEICILSGFRDPLDRGISAVAHNFGLIFPDISFAGDVRSSQVTFFNEQVMAFLDSYCSDRESASFQYLLLKWLLIDTSIDWFKEEYSATYGLDIDVVDIGNAPYVSFRHNGFLFVLYRLETLKDHLEEICELLSPDEFCEESTNIAAKKRYGSFLSDFREVFRPRPQAWDLFYRSEFYRHFYSDSEPIVPCGDG